MKTLRYSDNQPARKGDTFTAPRWGTCRITGFDKANACAVAVNTSTGEVFDMLGQPTFGESDLIAREPLKTAFDICRDFKALSTLTGGPKGGNVFTCAVELPNGETVKGIGSTLEMAEDTAWYGVKITLRETVTT